MPPALPKHVLFYSNFCPYSKEAIGILVKKNLRDRFLLVCLETAPRPLPPFVDCVPVLAVANTRPQLVLKDGDRIAAFLDTLDASGNASGSGGGGAPQELAAVDWFSYKIGYSDGFSYLDGDNAVGAHGGAGFLYAGIQDGMGQRIETPPESGGSSDKKGGGRGGGGGGGMGGMGMGMGRGAGTGGDLERLMQQRAQDIQKILGPAGGPGGPPPRSAPV
jgi:hypothetical protein